MVFITEYLGGEEFIQLRSLFAIATAQQHHSDSEPSLSHSHTILTGFLCIVIHMYVMHEMKLLIWQS